MQVSDDRFQAESGWNILTLLGRLRLGVTLHATQRTHHKLKNMLPQYCANYNDVFSLIVFKKKGNFSQAQYRLPDDGLHEPKPVGVTVKNVLM